MYGIYTVFLAEKLPYIRSYMVYMYGSGQLYILGENHKCMCQPSVRGNILLGKLQILHKLQQTRKPSLADKHTPCE
jgi:hypothetical protein